MVPRIAKRGHSFKGAGLYYLHDKDTETQERVAWTHTHNLPTQDADQGFRYMAHTAMNADRLKYHAGVSRRGRKRRAGPVYSFSLAWHPEQVPEPETMKSGALEILEHLGLSDHEAVFVAHQDQAHPHVHVICNLIHPETGRTAVPSYDYLTASRWAEALERDGGKIYCEQRVENNRIRRERANDNRQLALVKHKEKKLVPAAEIEQLYNEAQTPQEFQEQLQKLGFTLSQGDRRGFVLVDENGKPHSLSRQLKDQRAADIKIRLHGLDNLPDVKTAQENIQHFFRDDYETQRQKDIVDGAIEEDRKKTELDKQQGRLKTDFRTKNPKHVHPESPQSTPEPPDPSTAFLERLDALRAWEQKTDQARARLQDEQKAYGRDDLAKKIKNLEAELKRTKGPWAKLTGKRQALEDQLDGLHKNLTTIDFRIKEQNDALENQALTSKPDFDVEAVREQALEMERQKRIEYIKEQQRNRDRNRGRDFNP